MASNKEKDKKEKKSWFDLDSFISGYGLRWIKSKLNKWLGSWKAESVKHAQEVAEGKAEKLEDKHVLYFQLAGLFHDGDTVDRELVEASARVAVEVVDGLLDQMPFIPDKAKGLTDDLGGDAITEIRDHFANTDVVIPDNLPRIKGDKMAMEAGEKLKNLLKELFISAFDFLKVIADQLSKIHVGFSLRPKINAFVETLLTLPDPVVLENFSRFVDSELMNVEEPTDGFYTLVPDHDAQDDFVGMVQNWDTFPEFVTWFSKPLRDQREAFVKARMLKQHAGPARLHRDITEAIQAGGKAVGGLLKAGNDWLEEDERKEKAEDQKRSIRNRWIAGAVLAIVLGLILNENILEEARLLFWGALATIISAVTILVILLRRRSARNTNPNPRRSKLRWNKLTVGWILLIVGVAVVYFSVVAKNQTAAINFVLMFVLTAVAWGGLVLITRNAKLEQKMLRMEDSSNG